DVTMTPASNPGGVSATPSLSGAVSWPGGSYYFTSFTMANSATLSFTGAATIYLNGNGTVNSDNTITAYASRPSNLMIYVAPSKTFTTHDRDTLICRMQGPSASLNVHDDNVLMGSWIFNNITLHDRASMYYDESLGNPLSTS